ELVTPPIVVPSTPESAYVPKQCSSASLPTDVKYARIGKLALLSAAAVFAETALVPSYGTPKKPMSSRTTSFDAARKFTACENSRSVSPLANESFAPGVRSCTISSSAVPSAPALLNAHDAGGVPSRSLVDANDRPTTPTVDEVRTPLLFRVPAAAGRSAVSIG